MTIDRRYYTKFIKYKKQGILSYFQHLDLQDWIDFFNDYCYHETTYLLRILESPKGEDIYSYGLSYLEDVDSSTKGLISKANDYLLNGFLLDGKYEFFEELFFSIRYLELNVNSNSLLEIIQNSSLSNNIREHAAITLSVAFENSLIPFWDTLNLEQDKFLVPAYISFFEKINPVKGLSKLIYIKDAPENLSEFESPILYSLNQISISPSELEKYSILEKSLPNWSLLFISDLIQEYPELNDFPKKIESINSYTIKPVIQLEKVRLGASVFPDLMLIELFKKWGLFEEFNIDLIIDYQPWNHLLSHLVKKNVDVVIGNQKVMNYFNKERNHPMFKEWMVLNKFNGWAIVSKEKIKTFVQFEQENRDFALKNTLAQLKGKKIIASSNTDHYLTFVELIEKVGFKISEFNIIKDIDPQIGFINFMEGESDFFIGGASHTKKAISQNCFQLISEENKDFGADQRNVFITTTIDKKHTVYMDNIMTKFIFVLDKGMARIEDNTNCCYTELYNLFNVNLKKYYYTHYEKLRIDEKDFNSIITNFIEYKRARITEMTLSYPNNITDMKKVKTKASKPEETKVIKLNTAVGY